MIGDTGNTFQLPNRDFILWHTFSKSGGLKWLERSISASLLEPTAYTSGFISGSSTSDLDAELAALSMSMVGTRSLFASSSPPLMGSTQCSLGEPGSWVLYHAGNFVVSKPDRTIKLKFSMAQIDCTHTKGGLCVDSAFIYPKGFQQERMVRSQKCRC